MRLLMANIVKNLKQVTRGGGTVFILGRNINNFFSYLTVIFLYKYLFGGKVSIGFTKFAATQNYLLYVFLGILLVSYTHSLVTTVGRSIINEYREGSLNTLLLSLCSITNLTLSYLLQQIINMVLDVIVFLIFIKLFLSSNINGINCFNLVVAVVMGTLGMYGLTMVIGMLMVIFNDTYLIQNTYILLITLLSGIFYPIEYLPNIIQWISKSLPTYWFIKYLRYSFNLNCLFLKEKIFFFGISIGFLLIGILISSKMEKIIKKFNLI